MKVLLMELVVSTLTKCMINGKEIQTVSMLPGGSISLTLTMELKMPMIPLPTWEKLLQWERHRDSQSKKF